LYGVGTLLSGGPYLALVRDSAPERRQGLAISIVEIVLILCFAITGIAFSLWMKVYEERVFWEMVLATMAMGGFFWFFAIAGAERRRTRMEDPQLQERLQEEGGLSSFAKTMKQIWADSRTRRFFFFLATATFSAWIQDAVLEPFGAEVFDLPVERTTRLNSYWQAATVVTVIGAAYVWRKRPPERQSSIASGGLVTMALGMFLLVVAAVTGQIRLIELSLLVFGGGFGIYTFGGVSLMAVMASDKEAGAYLGLWSVSILVSKGVGTFFGGAFRDLLLLTMKLPADISYGTVFLWEAIGLIAAVFILAQTDVLGFARDVGRVLSRADAQIASAD
jgi:BCD family chlorophyll transporter-like MFS transporter